MRALLQRVTRAEVTVDGVVVGQCGPGLCVLICAVKGDGEEQAAFLARKIAKLRIFRDKDGKTNKSILDVGGSALVVSQFTLAAEWRKGNRPGFSGAADPEIGNALYLKFVELLAAEGVAVETGRFGAEMEVNLTNDGPFTIWMDTRNE